MWRAAAEQAAEGRMAAGRAAGVWEVAGRETSLAGAEGDAQQGVVARRAQQAVAEKLAAASEAVAPWRAWPGAGVVVWQAAAAALPGVACLPQCRRAR